MLCPSATGALVLAACLCGGCASSPPDEEIGVSAAVTRQELSAHVHYLSHPSLDGRAPKTKGGLKAVHYVSERLKACGLQPWPGATGLQMPFGLGTNVVGILPGSHPQLAKEIVLVIAHLDHLGRVSGKLYPGAADNASGTAALMELAEHFAGQEPKPARTICFLASDAEEKGLLGALAFACERLADPSRLAAVVNIDGLGRQCFEGLPDTMLVLGTEEYPDLRSAARRAAESQRLRALPIGADLLGARGDHVVFTPLGVPSLMLTCGMYRDYHGPGDTPDKIQYAKMLREVEVARRVVRHLADSSERARRVAPERGDVEELAAVGEILRVVRRHAWLMNMPRDRRRALGAAIAEADRLLVRPEQYTLAERWKYHERLAECLPAYVASPDWRIESIVAVYTHAMRHVLKHYPAAKDRIPPLTAFACEIPRLTTQVRTSADGRLDVETSLFKTTIDLSHLNGGLSIKMTHSVETSFWRQKTRREVIDRCLAEWADTRDDLRGGAGWDWLLEEISGENAADDYEGWLAWRDTASVGRIR